MVSFEDFILHYFFVFFFAFLLLKDIQVVVLLLLFWLVLVQILLRSKPTVDGQMRKLLIDTLLRI